jgi:hypothetical protein
MKAVFLLIDDTYVNLHHIVYVESSGVYTVVELLGGKRIFSKTSEETIRLAIDAAVDQANV